MCFDTFDILEAHYLFLSLWHEGRWSEKHRRLSRLTRHFTPRPRLRLYTLTPNDKAIYSALVKGERTHISSI